MYSPLESKGATSLPSCAESPVLTSVSPSSPTMFHRLFWHKSTGFRIRKKRQETAVFSSFRQTELKKHSKKFGDRRENLYLCTPKLSYGVMVAQQVLVLFVVVRIRLGQLFRKLLANVLFLNTLANFLYSR